MGNAVIFSGSDVKTLKDNINLNGKTKILTGSVDPTVTATSANKGSIYLSTSTGFTYMKQDSGSSTNWLRSGSLGGTGSEINYITNLDFETDASGWTAYDDASATPVDGTGGSPVSTFTRSTSSPLRGSASGLFAKPASNEQGDGVGYAFSIDTIDKGELCHIKFEYSTTANYSNGYIAVYVYDVTNATLITPTFKDVPHAINGGRHIAYFLSSETSTSYRLIFHNTTNTTTAWDFKIDNIIVGPSNEEFCCYSTDAGQTFNTGTTITVKFEDKTTDTHGAMNTSTGVYTFQNTGEFLITAKAYVEGITTWSAGERVAAYINKNTSTTVSRNTKYFEATIGSTIVIGFETTYKGNFLKGDTVEYQLFQNSGTNTTVYSDPVFNIITITRVSK